MFAHVKTVSKELPTYEIARQHHCISRPDRHVLSRGDARLREAPRHREPRLYRVHLLRRGLRLRRPRPLRVRCCREGELHRGAGYRHTRRFRAEKHLRYLGGRSRRYPPLPRREPRRQARGHHHRGVSCAGARPMSPLHVGEAPQPHDRDHIVHRRERAPRGS